MTTVRIEKVGLIAHYSRQGDWAFQLAYKMARANNYQLNIFYFLDTSFQTPYNRDPNKTPAQMMTEQGLIAEDRKLREYYDESLGDYVKVGFRVCTSVRYSHELRECLKKKDFQLLVVPYPEFDVTFGGMPLTEFAWRFNAPVILVGPQWDEQYYLNPPAQVLSHSIGLQSHFWYPVREPAVLTKPLRM
jgi:hypothetical protein